MDLYTSLTRMKQAMNGGRVPPMTPVPESAHHLIDPAFTIGLGAFDEDEEKGIRCPVRGCGRYLHFARRHLNTVHRDVGGAAAVLRVLSIPQRTSLVSKRAHERLSVTMGAQLRALGRQNAAMACAAARRRASARPREPQERDTVAQKNFRNRCVAQLSHRIIDLHHRIGRSPTEREFANTFGDAVTRAVRRTFGTWNNAKAHCGLAVYSRGRPLTRRYAQRDNVLEGLAAWYDVHRALPSRMDAVNPRRAPFIHSAPTIKKALGTNSWPEAMRIAASLLDIHGGRYGLPARKSDQDLRTESRAPSGVSAQAGRDTDAGEARPARSAIAAAGGR